MNNEKTEAMENTDIEKGRMLFVTSLFPLPCQPPPPSSVEETIIFPTAGRPHLD